MVLGVVTSLTLPHIWTREVTFAMVVALVLLALPMVLLTALFRKRGVLPSKSKLTAQGVWSLARTAGESSFTSAGLTVLVCSVLALVLLAGFAGGFIAVRIAVGAH